MNERIRELRKQACQWVVDNHQRVDPKNLSQAEIDQRYLMYEEKFAELVVAECTRIAAKTPCPYEDDFARRTYGHTWDRACVESAREIRKQFGVER